MAAVFVLHACGLVIAVSPLIHQTAEGSVVGEVFHDARRTAGPAADFFALYHAGVKVRHGESPYDTSEGAGITPYFYPYRYLPLTAHTIGRAATLLPPHIAALIWISVVELLLLVWVRHVYRASPRGIWPSCVLLLSAPYVLEVYLGQFTFVAVVLACLAAVSWARRPAAAGLLWAAAACLKVFPFVAAPAFLLTPRARVAWLVIGAVLLTNVPFFWYDPLAGGEFWSRNFLGEPVGLDAGNHSLLYAVYLAGAAVWGPWHLPTWAMVTLVWRLAVIAAAAAVVLTRGGDRLELSVALLLLAHFLSYFQVWEHHYSAVIAAGTLAYIAVDPPAGGSLSRWLLAGITLMALPTPYALLPDDPDRWTLWQRLAVPLSKALPLVVTFGATLARVLEAGPRPVGLPADRV